MNAVIIYVEDMEDPSKVQISTEIIGDPDLAYLLASDVIGKLFDHKNVSMVEESVFTKASPSKFLN